MKQLFALLLAFVFYTVSATPVNHDVGKKPNIETSFFSIPGNFTPFVAVIPQVPVTLPEPEFRMCSNNTPIVIGKTSKALHNYKGFAVSIRKL